MWFGFAMKQYLLVDNSGKEDDSKFNKFIGNLMNFWNEYVIFFYKIVKFGKYLQVQKCKTTRTLHCLFSYLKF